MGTWPVRKPQQAIENIMEMHTDTHRYTLSVDNIVCIQRNELRDPSLDPEFLQKTEGQPNCAYLNVENIDALIDLLLAAKARAS